jgi:transposase-like protein
MEQKTHVRHQHSSWHCQIKGPTCPAHRFPAEIISHCIWLYFRFCLSYRDVEELMAERGVMLTYEAVRYWCRKFGQAYANQLRRRCPRPGDKRMQGFKSPGHAQRFLAAYGPIASHFRPRRHLLPATVYRQQMTQRFQAWREITGIAVAA